MSLSRMYGRKKRMPMAKNAAAGILNVPHQAAAKAAP
jgi:hypothetical protein